MNITPDLSNDIRDVREKFIQEYGHLKAIARLRWEVGEIMYLKGYTADKFSPLVSKSRSVLTRCRQFYIQCPTLPEREEVINKLGSWSQICENFLPARAKDSDAVDGIATRIEQATLESEAYAMYPHDAEDRRELALATRTAAQNLLAVSEALDPLNDIPMEDAAPHFKPEINSPEMLGRPEIAIVQSIIRSFPCLRCEGARSEFTTFHHFPITKGAGGRDYWGVPLCPECHRWAQDHPGQFRKDPKVMQWYSDTIAVCLYKLSQMREG